MLRSFSLLLIVLLFSSVVAQQIGTVAEVISGDCFRLGDGRIVLMAGIDAPEPGAEPGSHGCYGRQAREFLAGLVLGKQVVLIADTLVGRGEADAALPAYPYSYMMLDTVDINRRMVARGYAMALLKFPFERSDVYLDAEIEARRRGLGLWAHQSGYQPCKRLCGQTPVDTTDWVEYIDRLRGYRLLIPSDTDIDSTDRGVWLRWPLRSPHINALSIDIEAGMYHACADCDPPVPAAEKQRDVDRVTIGDVPFCRRHWCEGAAGSVYEVTQYAALKDGKCYLVTYTLRFTNPEYYSPYPAPSFDREATESFLERIVASFRFAE